MNLKNIRKSRHLSQQDVADAIGIPVRTFCGYEREEREPTLEMLGRLADFFGVTVDELLGRTPQLFDDARVPKTEVQDLFDQLNSGEQARVIGYMENMLERRGIIYRKHKA